ncbi:uncharacterized protein A1O9_11128 [Exophiala aquamarina CBS 119918]|uniref:Uncharacterized protein n=1 Tax=Exophiala aquamarina CBS 119918 TaxID=1182545 RepID=A0A072NYR2_9EURO|nr:uncharacterized protein A1O9_11128 [Exophiala aquamarina CBS 119918]KEF52711.1 hypothetical protein A1O9_11128 [Exophiala aquamarina CBS 119918]
MAARSDQAEPFPKLETRRSSFASHSSIPSSPARPRTRTGSLIQSFIESNPPLGFTQAAGEVTSKIPTLPEIRNGAFSDAGWTHEGQMEQRGTNPHEIHRRRIARTSSASTRTRRSSVSTPGGQVPVITEERHEYFPSQSPMTKPEPVIEEALAAGLEGRIDEISQGRARSTSSKPIENAAINEKDASTASSNADGNGPQAVKVQGGPDASGTYPNGYRFPKKHTWIQSTTIGLKAFWKFFLTPLGFILTIYGLNVVAWGAMIFFVLLKAAPAMCHPNCEDDSSARQIWIEIDSQILNGLFCVTAYGLLPWRARDFYYLMQWRIFGKYDHHRRLAGVNRSWYRLPGSEKLDESVGPPPVYTKKHPPSPESPPPYTEEQIAELEANPAIPLPVTSMPAAPLTGVRAAPTKSWTLDFVVWMYMANTGFQVCLCVFMWHFNRFNRPAWGTALFIVCGCLVAIFAGVVVGIESSKVKKIEGIPIMEYDVVESVEDFQERKAKDEKKQLKHSRREAKKLKGQHWFTRH